MIVRIVDDYDTVRLQKLANDFKILLISLLEIDGAFSVICSSCVWLFWISRAFSSTTAVSVN